jgi:hypothetical protein
LRHPNEHPPTTFTRDSYPRRAKVDKRLLSLRSTVILAIALTTGNCAEVAVEQLTASQPQFTQFAGLMTAIFVMTVLHTLIEDEHNH